MTSSIVRRLSTSSSRSAGTTYNNCGDDDGTTMDDDDDEATLMTTMILTTQAYTLLTNTLTKQAHINVPASFRAFFLWLTASYMLLNFPRIASFRLLSQKCLYPCSELFWDWLPCLGTSHPHDDTCIEHRAILFMRLPVLGLASPATI